MKAGPIALFLDFDGTLVEIAPTPDSIIVAASLAQRLSRLAERLDRACAIVSGRSVDDIVHHLGERSSVAMAGSHGADIRDATGAILGGSPERIPEAMEEVVREFAQREGLGFEAKPHGAALHFRGDLAKAPTAHDFAHRLANQYGWVAQGGKAVVELVAGQFNKGDAVRTLMSTPAFQGAQPWFIGDDLTDERGFEACEQAGGGGIIVGSREGTAAKHALPDVASVHAWLGL